VTETVQVALIAGFPPTIAALVGVYVAYRTHKAVNSSLDRWKADFRAETADKIIAAYAVGRQMERDEHPHNESGD